MRRTQVTLFFSPVLFKFWCPSAQLIAGMELMDSRLFTTATPGLPELLSNTWSRWSATTPSRPRTIPSCSLSKITAVSSSKLEWLRSWLSRLVVGFTSSTRFSFSLLFAYSLPWGRSDLLSKSRWDESNASHASFGFDEAENPCQRSRASLWGHYL